MVEPATTPYERRIRELEEEFYSQHMEERNDRIMFAVLRGSIRAYDLWWRDQHPDYANLECEEEIYVPMLNPVSGRVAKRTVLGGKIDKIAWLKAVPKDKLIVVDHKTSAYDLTTGDYWDRLASDKQSTHYAALLTLSQQPPDDILWDVVGKPRIRPKTDVELESGDFAKRVADYMMATPHKFFARRSNAVTAQDVADYLAKLWEDRNIWRRQDNLRQKHKYHPQNFTACFNYNRRCEYFDVCHNHEAFAVPYWEYREPHGELDSTFEGMDILTYSRHKCWMTCPRMHEYKYIMGVRAAKVRDEQPLTYGTMWHELMDLWWKTKLRKESAYGL
jgi:hypothetical protein